MLGFDAIGRLALGEIPQGLQTIVLSASSGSYAVTGNALVFGASMPVASGSYAVSGNAAQLIGAVDSGSYAISGNAIGFATTFIATAGSYLITGQPVAFATTESAASGSYDIAGTDVGLIAAVDSGNYAIAGNDPLFLTSLSAESGSYKVTLGDYTLIRTGYDYAPDQYGIGHIKLAMVEARRLRTVVKSTPYPIINRPPALPQPQLHHPIVAPIAGLIDSTAVLDRLAEQQQRATAQAATIAKQQARNRAVAALLLAA